jgi:hypothetical protein
MRRGRGIFGLWLMWCDRNRGAAWLFSGCDWTLGCQFAVLSASPRTSNRYIKSGSRDIGLYPRNWWITLWITFPYVDLNPNVVRSSYTIAPKLAVSCKMLMLISFWVSIVGRSDVAVTFTEMQSNAVHNRYLTVNTPRNPSQWAINFAFRGRLLPLA